MERMEMIFGCVGKTAKDDASVTRSISTYSSSSWSDSSSLPSIYSRHKNPNSQRSVLEEFNYDTSPVVLFSLIQDKKWDEVATCAREFPLQIRTWVYRMESSYHCKIRWRMLPIHACCIFESPPNVVEMLLDNYPQGATLKDDQGSLPIHLACRNGLPKNLVKTLLEAFPASVFHTDRKSRTPLDLAKKSHGFHRDSVIMTLERFAKENVEYNSGSMKSPPDEIFSSVRSDVSAMSANEVSYEERTILFRLVTNKDWDEAERRSKKHPNEIRTWIVADGQSGRLRFQPLHKACVLSPPVRLIDALLSSYPEGAKNKDHDGWLPLHCACFYRAPESVIHALITAYAKGAEVKDEEGKLPLHYACIKGSSVNTIKSLLQAYPKSAQTKDNDGNLPIHLTCAHEARKEVVDALLLTYPKGAMSRDDQGRLPLHHACRENVNQGGVKALLKAFPRGSRMKDDLDNLPYHYACQNPEAKPVCKLLRAAYPESVDVKDMFGNIPLKQDRTFTSFSKLKPKKRSSKTSLLADDARSTAGKLEGN